MNLIFGDVAHNIILPDGEELGYSWRDAIDGRKGNSFQTRGQVFERTFMEEIGAVKGLQRETVQVQAQPPPDRSFVGVRGGKRADVRVRVVGSRCTDQDFAYDLSVVNARSLTAVRSASVDAFIRAKSARKCSHYKDMYPRFIPLVMTLTGGVTESTSKDLTRSLVNLCSEASRSGRQNRGTEDWVHDSDTMALKTRIMRACAFRCMRAVAQLAAGGPGDWEASLGSGADGSPLGPGL
jgi:hypothetical protein